MRSDIRDAEVYLEIENHFSELFQPGSEQISDAVEINVSPDGRYAVFSGTIVDKLEDKFPTRICSVDLETHETSILTLGPNVDRLAKFSPDGRLIAFLSDRHKAADYQLYLLEFETRTVLAASRVNGWVEYLHWSPDGRSILLGVAGNGADVSGGQGATTKKTASNNIPGWAPVIDAGDDGTRRRSAWVYTLADNAVRVVSNADENVWEASWCGSDAIAAVVSPGSKEGDWYAARLCVLDEGTGMGRELYRPRTQLGCVAGSPSGAMLCIVEALSSDRWIVAGDLYLIDVALQSSKLVDTNGVDVTYTEWRSEKYLLVAGHRGLKTVIGTYDLDKNAFREIWASEDISINGTYAVVSGFSVSGDCGFIGEGFFHPPEISLIKNGEHKVIKSFGLTRTDGTKPPYAAECVNWRAPDGLQIEGWLLRPANKNNCALVVSIHGGPVFHWRPRWLGRNGAYALMLLKRGMALFLPNPRGGSGRGQKFATYVVGDGGGGDAADLLSGIDHLVSIGIADPQRLGVVGGSYGGFMTSWLITQDQRFAAAVSIAPHTNHVSAHLLSNIPQFVSIFMADTYTNLQGKYFERSPVMHAYKAKTPTLNICGELDRSAPPAEAAQFHNALLENGVKSVLVTYPGEGHGVQKFPAKIDYAARIVAWFEEHLTR